MFGKDLKAANDRAAALASLLALTGFSLDASGALPTTEAFQAHLDARGKAAVADAVKAANDAKAAAANQAEAFAKGLQAAGVKLPEFAAEGFTVKDGEALSANAGAIKTAVETFVASKAAKQVAASGHAAALEVPAGGADTGAKPAAETPASAADFMATYKTLKGAEATEYFNKHQHRFPVR